MKILLEVDVVGLEKKSQGGIPSPSGNVTAVDESPLIVVDALEQMVYVVFSKKVVMVPFDEIAYACRQCLLDELPKDALD
jgi:hypothetical protein